LSINVKIILILGATTIAIFTIGTIVGFETSDSLLKDRMENQLISESTSRGNAIKNLINTRLQLVEILSKNNIIINLASEIQEKSDSQDMQIYPESSKEIFLGEIKRFQDTFQSSLGLVQLYIVGNDGNVLYSLNESNFDSLKLVIPKLEKNIQFFEFIQNNDGSKLMVISSTIFEKKSEPESSLGSMIAYLDVQLLDDILLNREGLGESGEVYLVNKERLLISESRFIENAAFNQRVDTFGVNECFDKGVKVNDVYHDYRGTSIFGNSYCARNLGFVLLAEIDEHEIFEPVTSLQNIIFSTSIVVSMVVAGIAVYISRTISIPITKLRDVADMIAGGNYEHKIQVKSNDEIGQLSYHLDKMRESILNTVNDLRDTESRLEQSLEKNKVSAEIIRHQMKELKIINEELIKKEKLKDEFLSMTSHELKTPLTPIMGWCEILNDPEISGQLTVEQYDAVNEIESNALKLKSLIEDLLDVQKLELQQMKFKEEEVDVNRICKQIENDFRFIIKEKQAQLKITCKKIPVFKSDEGKIIQVLSALFNNSVDYIPDKEGKIDLTVKEENNTILFSVTDNGIGIAKEKQKSLFKKFYQIDTSHTRHHGGTGLGLAISKGIVDLLGGRIWVESELGKGAKFCFNIPRRNT